MASLKWSSIAYKRSRFKAMVLTQWNDSFPDRSIMPPTKSQIGKLVQKSSPTRASSSDNIDTQENFRTLDFHSPHWKHVIKSRPVLLPVNWFQWRLSAPCQRSYYRHKINYLEIRSLFMRCHCLGFCVLCRHTISWKPYLIVERPCEAANTKMISLFRQTKS
jgi:hypothetical protein